MEKLRATIAVSLVATAATAGCTGHTNAAHGMVTGIFLMVGGPAPGVSVPLPGHVMAASTEGERFTVSTGRSGGFRLLLPPGTYNLTGYSPRVRSKGHEMRCLAARSVRVKAGRSLRGIDVFCSVR